MRLTPRSLQHRALFSILVPTLAVLLVTGHLGSTAFESLLLDQMREAAISRMQRTASHIDQRLRLPKLLAKSYLRDDSTEVRARLLEAIRALDGVVQVTSHRLTDPTAHSPVAALAFSEELRFAEQSGNQSVQLNMQSRDQQGNLLEVLRVDFSFFDFVGEISGTPWSNQVRTLVILDSRGNILSPLAQPETSGDSPQETLPGPVLAEILLASRSAENGDLVSNDADIPDIIYVFQRLKEASWTIVVQVEGRHALAPLLDFRKIYAIFLLAITTLILILTRKTTGQTVKIVNEVADAAERMAQGLFDSQLRTRSSDELGRLVGSFNHLSRQLQQGLKLQTAMTLAGEVQKSLLTEDRLEVPGLSARGMAIPCEETGGDFFDLLHPIPSRPEYLFVIGDVVGHGIGAALLMATARAYLRGALQQDHTLAACTSTANRLLCQDAARSGDFTTCLLVRLNPQTRELSWVRAGHEPGIVYSLEQKRFIELRGKGAALGLAPELPYQENRLVLGPGRHLLYLGTDGVSELSNYAGEAFGQERLRQFLEDHGELAADELAVRLTEHLQGFRANRSAVDDQTFIIITLD